jgi:uncharacterized membrane protein YccC
MKLWTWKEENLPSVWHAVRTAAAATLSVLLARLIRLPEEYWAVIATLVVMQSPLSSTVPLAIQRIVASALGALLGAIDQLALAQIWSRSHSQSLCSDSYRLGFVWKRSVTATPA